MQPAANPSLEAAKEADGPVLLFDGECGLCQRMVRQLIRLDRGARLRFATLQSPAAQAYLRHHGLPSEDFDSLVFVPAWGRRDRPEYQRRTAGVIAALRVVDGAGLRLLAGALNVLPERVRDGGYRWVARSRQRIFGPGRNQLLSRPEWKARFLG